MIPIVPPCSQPILASQCYPSSHSFTGICSSMQCMCLFCSIHIPVRALIIRSLCSPTSSSSVLPRTESRLIGPAGQRSSYELELLSTQGFFSRAYQVVGGYQGTPAIFKLVPQGPNPKTTTELNNLGKVSTLSNTISSSSTHQLGQAFFMVRNQ